MANECQSHIPTGLSLEKSPGTKQPSASAVGKGEIIAEEKLGSSINRKRKFLDFLSAIKVLYNNIICNCTIKPENCKLPMCSFLAKSQAVLVVNGVCLEEKCKF